MTKVKICGITNLEDAELSVKFGADALGFNFYQKSPRYITPENAGEIIEILPDEVLKVGVFVNESLEKIAEIAETAKLNALQLHGEETPEFAKELKDKTNLEIIKAFRVSPTFKPEDVLQYAVDAILLDAYNPKEHGGTGETFDWEIAKKVQEVFPKMYLAGGISGNNVGSAIRSNKPFAVDTCSKVEFEKGKKDKIKLINFIRRVKNVDENMPNTENTDWQNIKSLKTIPKGYYFHMMSQIHSLPEIYLSKKSLSLLMIYLSGFDDARGRFGIEFEDGFYPNGLLKWIISQLKVEDKPSLHFSNLILEECNNDEEKAFDLFFALLEEFKLEKETDSTK